MSNAFKDRWIRTGSDKQMLTIFAYLAKQGDISIPITELEQIEEGEVVLQSITDTHITLHYAPAGAKMFVIGPARAAERSPSPWPTTTNQPDPTIPERLAELLEPSLTSPLTTLDDAEMARREVHTTAAAEAARQSRVLRGQPLPLSHQPPHPPIKQQ